MTAAMTYNYLTNINATEAPAHFVPYNNTDDVWNKNWTQQEVEPGGLPHGPPFGPPPPTQEELMLQVYPLLPCSYTSLQIIPHIREQIVVYKEKQSNRNNEVKLSTLDRPFL